jgi:hypothetical protein
MCLVFADRSPCRRKFVDKIKDINRPIGKTIAERVSPVLIIPAPFNRACNGLAAYPRFLNIMPRYIQNDRIRAPNAPAEPSRQ